MLSNKEQENQPDIELVEHFDEDLNTHKFLTNKKVVIIVGIAILIILTAVFAFAKDEILLAVAPKFYIGITTDKTVKKIMREAKETKKLISAVKIGDKDSFTLEVGARLNPLSTGVPYLDDLLANAKDVGIDLGFHYNNPKNEITGQGKYLYNGKTLLNLKLFVNDDEFGIHIPELFSEYLTAPSKTFAEKFNTSFISEITNQTVSENLQISVSNLQNLNKKGLSIETQKSIKSATEKLIKRSKVQGVTNIKIPINGKEQLAKKIPLMITNNGFREYSIKIIDAVKSDENLRKKLLNDSKKMHNVYGDLDNLKAIVEEFMFDDIIIDFVSFNNMLVQISARLETKIMDSIGAFVIDVNTQNTDQLIDDISLSLSVSMDEEKMELLVSTKGVHTPNNGIYKDETSVVLTIPQQDNKIYFASKCEIDLNKNESNVKGELALNIPTIENLSAIYYGNYDHSKGIDFSINDVSIADSKQNVEFRYKLIKEDKSVDLGQIEKFNILDMNEAQFNEWGMSVSKKIFTIFQP